MVSVTAEALGRGALRRPGARRIAFYAALVSLTAVLLLAPAAVEFVVEDPSGVIDRLVPRTPLPREVVALVDGEPSVVEMRPGQRDAWFVYEAEPGTVAIDFVVDSRGEVCEFMAFDDPPREIVSDDFPIAHHFIGGRDSVTQWRVQYARGVKGPLTFRLRLDHLRGDPLLLLMQATAHGIDSHPPLELGRWTSVTLRQESGCVGCLPIDIPEGAKSIHVRVDGARSGVDLYLRRSDGEAGFWTAARSLLADESLDFAGDNGSLLAGRYELRIASDFGGRPNEHLANDEFMVAANVDTPLPYPDVISMPPEPPAERRWALPVPMTALVMIRLYGGSGSGTIVSPAGHILTAAHVVLDDSGEIEDPPIVVAVNDDAALPPRQLFVAAVREIDEERDLALLQIESTIRERDLRGPSIVATMRFPTIPLRVGAPLRIGEPVYNAGYTVVASRPEIPTLTVTRGIVSGIVYGPEEARLASLDAFQYSGMSGGLVLDENAHLACVPQASLDLDAEDGRTAGHFCVLVSAMPDSWRRTIVASH